MSLLNGASDFFGLDLGTTAARIIQLNGNGPTKQLVKYAQIPINSDVATSDSNADQQRVAQALKELISNSHISTNNVAVGVPSNKVFTTVVDIDRLPVNELANAIHYQADSIIPTPISESKLDWAVVGNSPKDKTKQEILLTSVTNDFIEKRLDMLESIGLNVIAFEPDNLAIARALLAPDAINPQMVLDVGYKSTDIVIVMNGAPRLTRSIPTGVEAIIRSATQNLNIDAKRAEQFVFKFGLAEDKLEGQIYNAIVGTVEIIINDIQKSIKFFSARYNGATPERIIVSGAAVTMPEFPKYIANATGLNVEIGNTWRNVSFPSSKTNELMAISSNFGVAIGLAERKS